MKTTHPPNRKLIYRLKGDLDMQLLYIPAVNVLHFFTRIKAEYSLRLTERG